MIVALVGCTISQVPPTTRCTPVIDTGAHPRDVEYQAILQSFYDDNAMPGALVGILRAGEDPWVGAIGSANLSHDDPLQTCTPVRTGSVAKMVLGTLVMQLVEEEVIGLDQSLADALPEAADRVPSAGSMTIRQMLNHSSGLRHPSDDDLGYGLAMLDDPAAAAARPFEEDIEREIYDHPLLFEPGTESHYSNGGYWLLARIVEEATGGSVADALEERLFAPNGLDSMRLVTGPDDSLARGYTPMDGKVVDVTDWDRADSDGDPAGGVASDAMDLLRFGQLLFDGTLVTADSLAAMQETTSFPSCPGDDCEFGLGIESLHAYPVVGYGKNGSLPGVDANLFVFPDASLALVAFANWGSGNHKEAFGELFE